MCWAAKLKADYIVSKRLTKHFDIAEKFRIPWMVIVGQHEIDKGIVTITNKQANVSKQVVMCNFVEELITLISATVLLQFILRLKKTITLFYHVLMFSTYLTCFLIKIFNFYWYIVSYKYNTNFNYLVLKGSDDHSGKQYYWLTIDITFIPNFFQFKIYYIFIV